MKNSKSAFPTMKPQTIAKVFLGLVLFVSSLPASANAADLSQLIADTAKWESSQSQEPLRKLEQLARDSAGKKHQRAELEAALVKLLVPDSTFEARRFACQQLAVIGSDASVPAQAKLLQDNETIGLACLAFGNRPSAKADQALRAALPAARGQGRLQIISTLGNRRDAKAVTLLAKLARDADAAVAEAATRALGMIASKSACNVIAALRKEASPPFNNTLADASLRCAEALTTSGNREAAVAICEELLASSQSTHVRRGAFVASLALDKDGGEKRILHTLHGSDGVLKHVAIAAVSSLPGKNVSETLAQELPTLPPEEQIWLIGSLAVRADAPARAALIASLQSIDAGVRRAAAAALSRIGNATAVRPFAKAIAAAKDADEARALESALGSLPANRDTDKAIIAEIRQAQGDVRAHLVSALVSRRSPQVLTALLEEADNANPAVAKAAFRALAKAAVGGQLPLLLAKFAALRNADLRSEVEVYVEQAVVASDDASQRSAAVREALASTREVDSRCALLRLLPACGDAQALASLHSVASDADARLRDAAVRALAEWPDLSAWNELTGIWQKPDNDAHRSLALRGLVRLAGDANAHPDAKLVKHYRELLDGARGGDEFKLILGALGGAAHPEALKLALPLLEKPGVRAEAEVAVRKIAEAIKAKNPEAAKAALDRLQKK
jgi:HEAT repeat protein